MAIEHLANTDFQSLHELKVTATKDPKEALPQVAKQFEGIFLRTMLKTMRMGSHFIEESNPFRGKNTETFQEMLDGQYVDEISKSAHGVGLADVLTQQLGGTVHQTKQAMQIGQIPSKYIVPTKTNNLKTELAVAKPEVKRTKTESTSAAMIDNFVNSIWSKAKQAAESMGLDPKMLIAQAALETGWGQSVAKDADGSSSNNLFNIKAKNAATKDAVQVKTTEYIANTPIKINASFRKYASVEDSFNDYVSLIKNNERYQHALAHAGSPERYVNELSKAGYATDPHYGTKILSIYHGDELNEAVKRCGLSDEL